MGAGKYEDLKGYCRSATLDEIRTHGHVLTPGRYVGAEDVVDDGAPFEERFSALKEVLLSQLEHGGQLSTRLKSILEAIK
jgi:type I restriction enzyme M protein